MFGVGQINTRSGSYPDRVALLLSDCGDVVTKKSANQATGRCPSKQGGQGDHAILKNIRRHIGKIVLKLEREHNHNRRSRSHEQSPFPSCHCRIQPGIELFLQVRGCLSVEPSDLALEYHWGLEEIQQIGADGCDP
jgi:hypothetical protein